MQLMLLKAQGTNFKPMNQKIVDILQNLRTSINKMDNFSALSTSFKETFMS